jgi:hypothetical protein
LRVSQVYNYVYSRYTPCLTDLYLRVHPTPYSPDPKSFILDICRVNPRQIYTTSVPKYKTFWYAILAYQNMLYLETETCNKEKFDKIKNKIHHWSPNLTLMLASITIQSYMRITFNEYVLVCRRRSPMFVESHIAGMSLS